MHKLFQDSKKINTVFFIGIWGIITIGLFMRVFEWKATSYNTSILAISYKYGFTSRGFIGTIYFFLGELFNIDIWTYFVAFKFYVICTFICYSAFAIMMLLFLYKTKEENKKIMQYFIIIFTICFVSMFATEKNFGRIDMFMLLVTILAVLLIVRDKYVWFVIPLSALGVLFHQGYVFTFYNVVLVMILYRALCKEGNQRKKYFAVMVVSLLICGILFFWFQIAYRGGAYQYYDEIKRHATLMGVEGKPHDELLRAEILGVDLHDEELKYRVGNVIEIILFLILFLPYIMVVIRAIIRVVGWQNEKIKKGLYLAFLLEPLTTLPLYIFKVDFGRWTFSVVSYFLLLFISMYCIEDRNIIQSVKVEMMNIKTKVYRPFVFILPLLIVPFMDVAVSNLTDRTCILIRSVIGI